MIKNLSSKASGANPRTASSPDLNASVNKIYSFFNKNGRMPSYSEICSLCKINSKNTAHNLVKKLSAIGKLKTDSKGKIIATETKLGITQSLEIDRNSSRSAQQHESTKQESPLILLGLVEAGFPTPSEETLHENISLDDWVIDKKEASFMLKVKGDSMRDAGILDGDMVIVERTSSPKVGQIVVAEVDGSYTMKYLQKDSAGRMYLEPANSDFKSIYPKEDLRINAVVKAVVRKYR
ncbi:MAG: repressor LexA [Patescibacteria group bacterium]|nr:repressor LexA [Patescibacteria group bacterium]